MNTTGSNPRATRYSKDDTALLFVDVQKMFCLPGRDPGHPEMGADPTITTGG